MGRKEVLFIPAREAVNTAANRTRGLWLGYIALLAYLFITLGAVTHRDLLLQIPVTLPVFNVELPLIGFFAVAPIFFFINHFYLMLNLLGLSRRIREFNSIAVDARLPIRKETTQRRQLDTFIIVQMLGGTKEETKGWTSVFLRLIAAITLVISPILLLLFMQLQFLAYQNQTVTWIHRITLLTDLAMICVFWPAIRIGQWAPLRILSRTVLCSVPIVLFSWLVATFPGELIDRNKHTTVWKTQQDSRFWQIKEFIFGSASGNETSENSSHRQPGMPFLSRNLELANNQTLIDPTTLHEIRSRFNPSGNGRDVWDDALLPSASQRTRSFRGRNLRGAVLDRSDLRNVEFDEAALQGASLQYTKLQGATLYRARLEGASLEGAKLQSASLLGANLQGAVLDGANLRDATLDLARLQGASLFSTWLNGASLDNANLQGAKLDGASLQGAFLDGARLQGSSLYGARLQGASLKDAKLHGASLFGALFDGATLRNSKLYGASLERASFHGASLNFAKLQGATLENVKLQGASLITTHFWRSYGQPEVFEASEVNVVRPIFKELSLAEISDLTQQALEGVEDQKVKNLILERLSRLGDKSLANKEITFQKFWEKTDLRKDTLVYGRKLKGILWSIACTLTFDIDAPYVSRALIGQEKFRPSHIEAVGPLHLSNLAQQLLDAVDGQRDDCPGVKGLDAASIAKLRGWAKKTDDATGDQR